MSDEAEFIFVDESGLRSQISAAWGGNVKFKEIEVGKQYRWKRPFAGQVSRVVRTVATVGIPPLASANWRDHTPDGVVTVVKKSWLAIVATDAAGNFVSVMPEHLHPLEEA